MVHCSLHPSEDRIFEDAGDDAWVHDDGDGDVPDDDHVYYSCIHAQICRQLIVLQLAAGYDQPKNRSSGSIYTSCVDYLAVTGTDPSNNLRLINGTLFLASIRR